MTKPEKTLNEETLYQGNELSMMIREVELANGQHKKRPIATTAGAVVILPRTVNNDIRLIKQYRAAAQKWLYELPAGGLEVNEDPAEAAPRELLEETGDQAKEWHYLGGFYTAPGFLNEFLYLYLATDLTPGPNRPEFDEHIEVVTVSWADVIRMIDQGDIEDAKTIAGIMKTSIYLNFSLTDGTSK
ncbi:MAG: NUDIX hydrolase [Chloroflexota bacterium]